MADSTEANLQVVDQTTGGNNNTWGDIADLNFTKLVQALTHEQSIATTGGLTTLTDDQQRPLVLDINGTLTSNAQIAVNDGANKMWIVQNNTSGAYTVTVKTDSGTGVTVDQGDTKWLYADGTNVIDVSPSVAAATSTGNLTFSGDAILQTDSVSGTTIGGDTTTSTGISVQLYGASHASLPDYFRVMEDTTAILQYDGTSWTAPVGTWTFTNGVTVNGQVAINNALTVTGAFASVGFDDNATARTVLINDSAMQLGENHAGNFSIYRQGVANQSLRLAGGTSGTSGANWLLYGPSAGNNGDAVLYTDSSLVYWFDNSNNRHRFYAPAGTEVLEINSSGLDVTGNITVSGTVDGVDLSAANFLTKYNLVYSGEFSTDMSGKKLYFTMDCPVAGTITQIKTYGATGGGTLTLERNDVAFGSTYTLANGSITTAALSQAVSIGDTLHWEVGSVSSSTNVAIIELEITL